MVIRQRNFYPVVLQKIIYSGGPNFKILAFESTDEIYQNSKIETNTFNGRKSISVILKFDYDISELDIGLPFFIKTKIETDQTRGNQNIAESITRSYESISKDAQRQMIELLPSYSFDMTNTLNQLSTKKEKESLSAIKTKHEELVAINPQFHIESNCPICALKKQLTLTEKIEILLRRENAPSKMIQWLTQQNLTSEIDLYNASEYDTLEDCIKTERAILKHNQEFNLKLIQKNTRNYQRKVMLAAILRSESSDFENHQDFTFGSSIVDHYIYFDKAIRDDFNQKEAIDIVKYWIKKQDLNNYNDNLTHKTFMTPARKDDFFTIVDTTLNGPEKVKIVTVIDYIQYKDRLNFIENNLKTDKQESYDEKTFNAWINNQTVIPTQEQTEAITKILEGNSISLTGSAGTGKTQTTQLIIRAIKQFKKNIKIINLASTGEAANNMMSNFNIENARTLHSYVYTTEAESNKKDQLILIDESSMLDNDVIDLLINKSKQLKEMGNSIQFLFIGDIEQLPAVGKGAPFVEFVKFGNTVKLTQQFRQQNGSKILTILDSVLDRTLVLNPKPQEKTQNDLTYKQIEESNVKNEVLDFTDQHKITTEQLIQNKWKLITPTNKTRLLLNEALQEKLNPVSNNLNKVTVLKNQKNMNFHLGSPVVLLQNGWYVSFDKKFKKLALMGDIKIKEKCSNDEPKNTHIKGLTKTRGFNGQRGIISEIVLESKTGKPFGFLVKTKELEHPLFFYIHAFGMTKNVDLSFVSSVHKAQGGQCEQALIVDVRSTNWSRRSNMVYTAWSRTKNNDFLLTDASTYNIQPSQITSFMLKSKQ